jgi:uncharacterized repeat protein (TIGR03806 family)
MDATKPTSFASFVIPYEVNSPLWSDGADKSRGMVIPSGSHIHVRNCTNEAEHCQGTADNGDWDFPVGSVLLKNFGFDGKLVETRLFVHFDEKTWVGYGYAWNEAQTEATLVPKDGAMVTFNTGTRNVSWNYPSRLDCMTCHDDAPGYTLGPETAQMNRVVNGENQLDRFAALGVFDAPLPTPYIAPLVTPYAGQAGTPPSTATLDERARSYLHANCGYCHRPGGDFDMEDLRFDTPFKDTNTCGAYPVRGTAGIDDAVILAPGDPDRSVLLARMISLEYRTRMPQIGTQVVDESGVQLISDWIKSITSCP